MQEKRAAEVRSVDFPKLLGGGVLHTKLILIDRKDFYVGSANMDWRALTEVKVNYDLQYLWKIFFLKNFRQ